jgi:hypothetical protein
MRLLPALAVTCLFTLSATLFADDDVSRVPPKIYKERIAAQLTPLADVLAGKAAFSNSKRGGVNLLHERIVYRDAQGHTYRAVHVASYASDQSGVEHISSDTFSYDRLREEICLISAQTILPNGESQNVGVGSAFIQTPQRQADESIYTSQAELRIIYPKAAPGATTEAIVLIHEKESVIPGQFALVQTYGSSWPIYRDRLVLDFPTADLERVKATITGSGVPDSRLENSGAERKRKVWQRDRIPEIEWEENGPEWTFRGPTLWLTTVDSWNQVTEWYNSLVVGRSDLSAELKAQVDTWTTGLVDRRAIVERLSGVVSTEVRYVGLEFGLAGYQPHPCGDVWTRRYGDCKDKANLLRALLEYKGIKSHLVLLDTRGMGRIEPRSPSWIQFNHVILAVENEGAGYLFCDPTVERLPAGKLALADQARDVLLIKNGKPEWLQTPDLLSSSIRIEAELSLAADGSLSGWFDFGGTGSDAAFYASYFNNFDRPIRLQKMQAYVEQFVPGATVVDIDFTPPAAAVEDVRIRGYLTRPSRSAGDQTMLFPFPSEWLPTVTTQGTRRFPYAVSRREEVVNISIQLPSNWTVRTLPAPFSAESPAVRFEASWSSSPGKVVAHLNWHPKRAVLAPSEYAGFQTSVRAMTSWLAQPVVLGIADGRTDLAASPMPKREALHDFPILPTGEGQLRLLEQKYPEDKDNNVRRAALERVLQWFPQDAETVFTAQVKLALLDESRDGDKAFALRVTRLINQSGPQVDHALRAWAEFLAAKAQWISEHDPLAIAKLRELADDTSLNTYRRGWSAEAAGRYLRESDPKAAREFLISNLAYDSEARSAMVRSIVGIFATQNDATGLDHWVRTFAREHADVADSMLAEALKQFEGSMLFPEFRQESLLLLTALTSDNPTLAQTSEQVQKLTAQRTMDESRGNFLAGWMNIRSSG